MFLVVAVDEITLGLCLNLFFDKIRNAKHMMYNYEKRQPVVLWFDYLVYGGFRVFKFTGSGPNWIEGVIDIQ